MRLCFGEQFGTHLAYNPGNSMLGYLRKSFTTWNRGRQFMAALLLMFISVTIWNQPKSWTEKGWTCVVYAYYQIQVINQKEGALSIYIARRTVHKYTIEPKKLKAQWNVYQNAIDLKHKIMLPIVHCYRICDWRHGW